MSILATNISVNSANARNTFDGGYFGGMGNGGYGGMGNGGYGGMGYGGAGPVIQEQVDTGNLHLDKAINKFYNCLSHTHEDPPTVQKVDVCYHQTLGGSNGGRQT
ncbi:MAG: hypothetical protein WBZ36_28890 [Candidatus Nitrosopolaris sp.]